MRTLFVTLALVGFGCGDDGNKVTDAAPQVDAPVIIVDCNTYCSTIQANCTGTNAQYPSMENCMGSCATFPAGALSDTTGNTLGCRIYHADAPAKMTPSTHCFHAGPGGAGADGVTSQCGGDCDGFCSIVQATCPGKYADVTACKTACGTFASAPPFVASATGNNRQCRLYHATNAAATGMTPGNVHCIHATATGNAAPCMSP